MAVQSTKVNTTYQFFTKIINASVKEYETILRDASRVTTKDLAQYTVMAQIGSSGKWVPWTSFTASDGTAYPLGILMAPGGISAASIIAADVVGVPILVGGPCEVDSSQLVFDTGYNGGVSALALSQLLTTNAVGSGAATVYQTISAEAWLRLLGIFCRTTLVADLPEN